MNSLKKFSYMQFALSITNYLGSIYGLISDVKEKISISFEHQGHYSITFDDKVKKDFDEKLQDSDATFYQIMKIAEYFGLFICVNLDKKTRDPIQCFKNALDKGFSDDDLKKLTFKKFVKKLETLFSDFSKLEKEKHDFENGLTLSILRSLIFAEKLDVSSVFLENLSSLWNKEEKSSLKQSFKNIYQDLVEDFWSEESFLNIKKIIDTKEKNLKSFLKIKEESEQKLKDQKISALQFEESKTHFEHEGMALKNDLENFSLDNRKEKNLEEAIPLIATTNELENFTFKNELIHASDKDLITPYLDLHNSLSEFLHYIFSQGFEESGILIKKSPNSPDSFVISENNQSLKAGSGELKNAIYTSDLLKVGFYFNLLKCNSDSLEKEPLRCEINKNYDTLYDKFRILLFKHFLGKVKSYDFAYQSDLLNIELDFDEKLTLSILKALYIFGKIDEVEINNKFLLNFFEKETKTSKMITGKVYENFIVKFWRNIDFSCVLKALNKDQLNCFISNKELIHDNEKLLVSFFQRKQQFPDGVIKDFLEAKKHQEELEDKVLSATQSPPIAEANEESTLLVNNNDEKDQTKLTFQKDDFSLKNLVQVKDIHEVVGFFNVLFSNNAKKITIFLDSKSRDNGQLNKVRLLKDIEKAYFDGDLLFWKEIFTTLLIGEYFLLINCEQFEYFTGEKLQCNLIHWNGRKIKDFKRITYKSFLAKLASQLKIFTSKLSYWQLSFEEKFSLSILKVLYNLGYIEIFDNLGLHFKEYLMSEYSEAKEIFEFPFKDLVTNFWSISTYQEVEEVFEKANHEDNLLIIEEDKDNNDSVKSLDTFSTSKISDIKEKNYLEETFEVSSFEDNQVEENQAMNSLNFDAEEIETQKESHFAKDLASYKNSFTVDDADNNLQDNNLSLNLDEEKEAINFNFHNDINMQTQTKALLQDEDKELKLELEFLNFENDIVDYLIALNNLVENEEEITLLRWNSSFDSYQFFAPHLRKNSVLDYKTWKSVKKVLDLSWYFAYFHKQTIVDNSSLYYLKVLRKEIEDTNSIEKITFDIFAQKLADQEFLTEKSLKNVTTFDDLLTLSLLKASYFAKEIYFPENINQEVKNF